MYIIMFSHTQLTTTLLLVLIFASKVHGSVSLFVLSHLETQLSRLIYLSFLFNVLTFCLTQQAYLALRGRGKGDDSTTTKPQAAKFLAKPKSANHSNVTPSVGSFKTDMIPELSSVNDPDIQVSILKLFAHCWFY